MAAGNVNSEILRKQLMVNQMVNAVGCTPEQATTILQQAQWHPDVSVSPPSTTSLTHSLTLTHLPAGGTQSLLQRQRSVAASVGPSSCPPWTNSEFCRDLCRQCSLTGNESGFLCEPPFDSCVCVCVCVSFLGLFQNTFSLTPHNITHCSKSHSCVLCVCVVRVCYVPLVNV